MICENCGCELAEKSVFCQNCGAKIKETREPEVPFDYNPGKEAINSAKAYLHISPDLVQSQDGTIRWIYELSLWKNPTILLTVSWVLLIGCGFVGLLIFFVTLSEGLGEAVKISLSVFGITAGILAILMLIVYPIFCAASGGKYCVLFEMDNKGVRHTQLGRQFDKARAMGLLTAFTGGVTGNIPAVGAGLLSASRQSMYTSFKSVSRVSVRKRRGVIYIGTLFEHNQVYAEARDFEFICDYIIGHIGKNVKVKGRG